MAEEEDGDNISSSSTDESDLAGAISDTKEVIAPAI